MISEQLAHSIRQQWIDSIESISIDGWSRNLTVINSYPMLHHDVIYLNASLDPLKRGAEENDDYSSRLYSKWSDAYADLFTEIFQGCGEEMISSPNRTDIRFGKAAQVENNRFYAIIRSSYAFWAAAERNTKLRKLLNSE